MIILGISLITFLGYLISHHLLRKISIFERLGLSYLLGMGIFTFAIFLSNLVGIGFSRLNSLVLLILFILVAYFALRLRVIRLGKEDHFESFRKLNPIVIILSLGILACLLYNFVISVYWPVGDWDAIALYDFRAKVFLHFSDLDSAIKSSGYFLGYPLLTSLTHTFIYQLGGENPKVIYFLFYLSFLLVFYGFSHRFVSRETSILTTLLLSTQIQIFSHASIAYTNLVFTIYFSLSAFYLYAWIRQQKSSLLILSAILLGLSSWTRSSEPFWLVNLVILFIYSIKNKKLLSLFLYPSVFLFLYQIWKSYEAHFASTIYSNPVSLVEGSLSVFFANLSLERFREVINFIFKNSLGGWNSLVLLLVVSLLLGLRFKIRRDFLTILLGCILLLIFGTYVFSVIYPGWMNIPDSAKRMSMVFIPIIVLYSGFVINKIKLLVK